MGVGGGGLNLRGGRGRGLRGEGGVKKMVIEGGGGGKKNYVSAPPPTFLNGIALTISD